MISFKQKRLGIDLGTANSIVFIQGAGVVFEEPTIVAIDVIDLSIVSIGKEAKQMLGKTPENIIIKRPLKSGVIASARITEELLRFFINKAVGRIRFFKPEVMISAPVGITSVEKRAIVKAALQAGASKVYLIPEPLAAAIGAKLPIHSSAGNMIVNIGGGTTEIAVISLNGIVISNSIRVAGDAFNDAIISYARKERNLIIGEQMSEKIKMTIGSAMQMEEPLVMEVSGRDLGSGLPRIDEFNSNEIAIALKGPISEILMSIKRLLEKTPPELSADIIDRGIVMSGGSSMLRNLDKLFTKAMGVPAFLADDPIRCVAKGTGIALEFLPVLKKSLTTY
ncbi:MAG: rod shape-determining protein [Candidatus Dojkabacteria bacterium]|nr:MAG: rod shape-determining protein [Candidatus Dojkabacteria bacterium]